MATHSSILAWRILMDRGAGYSPWGRKESDMTEQLKHTHTHTHPSFMSSTSHGAPGSSSALVCEMHLVRSTSRA